MSFENPIVNSNNIRPWTVKCEWKGGEKIVEGADGKMEKVLEPYIRCYNAETKTDFQENPEMKIAVVGVTSQIGGGIYDKNNTANNASYYSNEVVNIFDQPLKVFKRTFATKSTEPVFDGLYMSFKDNMPKGMQLQINVYFYDFKTKRVNRLDLLGCARGAWFSAKVNNSGLYDHWLTVAKGETKIVGTSMFIPPEFKQADTYTKAERDEIVNSEDYKLYAEWEKKIASNRVAFDPSIDQTPATYSGEESQEVPAEDTPIDLSDIPF